MSLKDILVCLTSPETAPGILDAAVSLARRHEAHVTALHVSSLEWPLLAVDGFVSADTWQLILDEAEQLAREKAEQIRRVFDEVTRRENIQAEWRLEEGLVAQVLVQQARYADIAILGRSDEAGTEAELAEAVLFDAGRPVMLLPRTPPRGFGAQRVLIGWNGRREAARAVGDALPLIRAAEAVRVLSVYARPEEQAASQVQTENIARHLARHGAAVSVSTAMLGSGLLAEDVLLNAAADLGADLLVIGGYGHGRVREVVLGGVTRSLLHSSTIPVLLSHCPPSIITRRPAQSGSTAAAAGSHGVRSRRPQPGRVAALFAQRQCRGEQSQPHGGMVTHEMGSRATGLPREKWRALR
ncbi:universal stress protein [Roseomonas marmotae]|uniref:Universal stress protein n=1 Tax=Roseomonas marmotae TaxID=2768161 RepID=A0ABS3KGF4_9PROT|nr:universal stress protein [Roseomonas marmotae]MBO1076558.1 universal stress protein [Roseomonas marmotae]QTI81827.1 universal stress protein [Roseomonas marmotae]